MMSPDQLMLHAYAIKKCLNILLHSQGFGAPSVEPN